VPAADCAALTLVLRDIPVNRVRSVRRLSDARLLQWTAVPALPEVHRGAVDPRGELVIAMTEDDAAGLCPVFAVDLAPPQARLSTRRLTP